MLSSIGNFAVFFWCEYAVGNWLNCISVNRAAVSGPYYYFHSTRFIQSTHCLHSFIWLGHGKSCAWQCLLWTRLLFSRQISVPTPLGQWRPAADSQNCTPLEGAVLLLEGSLCCPLINGRCTVYFAQACLPMSGYLSTPRRQTDCPRLQVKALQTLDTRVTFKLTCHFLAALIWWLIHGISAEEQWRALACLWKRLSLARPIGNPSQSELTYQTARLVDQFCMYFLEFCRVACLLFAPFLQYRPFKLSPVCFVDLPLTFTRLRLVRLFDGMLFKAFLVAYCRSWTTQWALCELYS